MATGQFDEAYRRSWFARQRYKIDQALKELATETDAKARGRLQRSLARYYQLLTMGPEAASEAARKAAAKRAGNTVAVT